MSKFRKFMIKYVIGLTGFSFMFGDKEFTVSYIKGSPYFFVTFLLMGVFCALVPIDWIRILVCVPIAALIYFLGFWYPANYPLTKDEAKEIDELDKYNMD